MRALVRRLHDEEARREDRPHNPREIDFRVIFTLEGEAHIYHPYPCPVLSCASCIEFMVQHWVLVCQLFCAVLCCALFRCVHG